MESQAKEAGQAISEHLRGQGARFARISHADLHGNCRSKELPVDGLEAVSDGLGYAAAHLEEGIHGVALKSEEFSFSKGMPDLQAVVDFSTARRLPWDPKTTWLVADLKDADGCAHLLSSRDVLRRACVELEQRAGVQVVAGPELEFVVLRRRPDGGLGRYTDGAPICYTTGAAADPEGVFRSIHLALDELGIGATTGHHESAPGQFEINLEHGPAIEAADRSFLLKAAAKEVASRHGMVASFMPRPFEDHWGNSLHLHLSLTRGGANAFDGDVGGGLSEVAQSFAAGVLEHAPGLTLIASPTVNSYKRLLPGSAAPVSANWGYDDRGVYVRVPPGGGEASRLEVRAADASANPYLLCAALVFAGLDGLSRELRPPDLPAAGASAPGVSLPRTLDGALAAFERDNYLVEKLGPRLAKTFVAIKRAELERYRRAVTDWEWNEYATNA